LTNLAPQAYKAGVKNDGKFRGRRAKKAGQKGGKNRARSLSPSRRREIAKAAAAARWGAPKT